MGTLRFIIGNARWLAAGFVLAFGSCFGQTFFIAVFSQPLRAEFGLSYGEFGGAYMAGTLASAFCIIQLGRLADILSARPLAAAITLCLAAVCIAMAFVSSWPMLIVVIFGLRMFGQGMMSHLSQTCMARWFDRTRGRAIAIASFGYPIAQAVVPSIAVVVMATTSWRNIWLGAAAVLALCIAPLLWALLAKDRPTRLTGALSVAPSGIGGKQWSRMEIIRQPLFWMLAPGFIAPSFMITVIFFLPSHIAETKGWALDAFTNRYWLYAAMSLGSSIIGGLIVDRFSARACLPYYQLPMAAGMLVLAFGESPMTISILMILVGASTGIGLTVKTALWAEIYGTKHIGAIKALAQSIMVAASAAGPGITGVIIDLGAPFPTQAVYLAGYAVAVSLLYGWIVTYGPLSNAFIASTPELATEPPSAPTSGTQL